jgi:hypothetical protein
MILRLRRKRETVSLRLAAGLWISQSYGTY